MADEKAVQRQSGEETRGEHRSPDVDIYEEGDKLVLVADMPGAAANGLELGVEEGTLVLKAARERPDPKNELVYGEFIPVDYYRAFALSDAIETEKIQASMKDGVLTVELPKVERVKTRKIEVKGE